ncbi:MAG: hypothetical protein JKY11_05985 [Alphaproteobacteria bacterium]|nr:hypothetical protein [Alphaproteobacteria bacterium]
MSKVTSYTEFLDASKVRDIDAGALFHRNNVFFQDVYQRNQFEDFLNSCLIGMRQAVELSKKHIGQEGVGYVQRAMPIYLGFAFGKDDLNNVIRSYESHLKSSNIKRYVSLMRRKNENEGFAAFDIVVQLMLNDFDVYADLISKLRHNFPQMEHQLFIDYREDTLYRPAVVSCLREGVNGDIKSHFQAFCDRKITVQKTADIYPIK